MKQCLVLITSVVLPVFSLWIDIDGNVRGSSNENDFDTLSALSAKESVTFWHSEIDELSSEMLHHLNSMTELVVLYGNVKAVYVKPKLEKLFLNVCNTSEIVIEPDGTYCTKEFTVKEGLLKELPTNLNQLKLLEKIDLWDNKIECIEMSTFNSFENLTYLSLSSNRIKVLTSSGVVNLPMLQYLSLFSNQLSELDVCWWNMPSLETLWLANNRLTYVVNLLHQFPNLTKTSLHLNSLNCQWQKTILNGIGDTKISLKENLTECYTNDRWTAPLECSFESRLVMPVLHEINHQKELSLTTLMPLVHENFQLREMFTNMEDELRSIQKNLKKYVDRSAETANKRIEQLEEIVKKQSAQFEKQQLLLDDLNRFREEQHNIDGGVKITDIEH